MVTKVTNLAKNRCKGKIKIFVYGTLKSGHSNNPIIADSGTFICRDLVKGNYRMVSLGGFPGVIFDPDAPVATIYGEVWAGDEKMLEACDWLEGYPSFYSRAKVRPFTVDSNTWIYFLPDTPWSSRKLPPVENNIWEPRDVELTHWGIQNGAEN